MTAGKAFVSVAFSAIHWNDFESHKLLKRKRDLLPPPAAIRGTPQSYPSPPMSSPPSPPRQPTETLSGAPSSSTFSAPPSTTSTASLAPLPPPQTYQWAPPAYSVPPGPPPPPPPPPPPAPFSTQPGYHRGPPTSALGPPGGFVGPSASIAPSVSISSTSEPASIKTGRKSKQHVASACVNCKKAHLSCDSSRPCARCVQTNKQDTCYDVAHKKRGRPRLRDDGDFKVEQILQGPPPGPAPQLLAGPSTPRPIAGNRHRRTESLRSLRSSTSEFSPGHGQPTSSFPPSASMPPPSMVPQPRELTPAEVPTAFLDLDFVVIRANTAFRQIIAGNRDISNTRIADLIAAAEGPSVPEIRDDLRIERERREPLFMPPIIQPGHDPLNGISEADVERLTQSYADRTYRWTRIPPSSETFPVRVRLGRADVFFVAVTLPSFRPDFPPAATPQLAIPSYPPGLPAHSPPLPGPPSAGMYPPVPYPAPYGSPMVPAQASMSRPYGTTPMPSPYPTYPGASPRYSAPQPAYTSQPPTAPPHPSPAAPFTSRSEAPGPARQLQPALQLPALLNPTIETPGRPAQQQQGPTTSDEEDEEGRKKRRKVDLSDVLQ